MGKSALICFHKLSYPLLGAILALLNKKRNTTKLLIIRINVIIRATKAMDATIFNIERLEYWQRLKVYGIILLKYLGSAKMKLLRRKIGVANRKKGKQPLNNWLIRGGWKKAEIR